VAVHSASLDQAQICAVTY